MSNEFVEPEQKEQKRREYHLGQTVCRQGVINTHLARRDKVRMASLPVTQGFSHLPLPRGPHQVGGSMFSTRLNIFLQVGCMDVFTSSQASMPGLLVRLYYPWLVTAVNLTHFSKTFLPSARPPPVTLLNGCLGFQRRHMPRYRSIEMSVQKMHRSPL